MNCGKCMKEEIDSNIQKMRSHLTQAGRMRRKSSWAEFGVENGENSTERGAPFVIGSSRKNRAWPN